MRAPSGTGMSVNWLKLGAGAVAPASPEVLDEMLCEHPVNATSTASNGRTSRNRMHRSIGNTAGFLVARWGGSVMS
jgi:hypothetical protein